MTLSTRDLDIARAVLARRSEPSVSDVPDTVAELLELAREAGGDIAPEGEPEILDEHHDPVGDVLPFHVASGQAAQVLGSRPIDESRYPDTSDPFVTDTRGRALRTEHSLARVREMREALDLTVTDDSPLSKLLAKWGARLTGVSASR